MVSWPYLIDTRRPGLVYDEVKRIVTLIAPEFGFNRLGAVFQDIVSLYSGLYPGFKACNTGYHDLTHVMDTVLAMARLLHGAAADGFRISKRNIGLGLTAALMHDTGYIQKTGDRGGTGGKYTLNHPKRSVKFMENYFLEHGYSIDYFEDAKKVLSCTALTCQISRVRFRTEELRIIGKMLATVDIMGQMGSRIYLEKLLLLFQELKEAKLNGYKEEIDVFTGTFEFHETAQKRLEGDLSDVKSFMGSHFRSRYGVERDFYSEQIEHNLKHLAFILQHKDDYRTFLRRAGIVNALSSSMAIEKL
jgi:predicted metal-dependent HD superfamily phosphohydrolase